MIAVRRHPPARAHAIGPPAAVVPTSAGPIPNAAIVPAADDPVANVTRAADVTHPANLTNTANLTDTANVTRATAVEAAAAAPSRICLGHPCRNTEKKGSTEGETALRLMTTPLCY